MMNMKCCRGINTKLRIMRCGGLCTLQVARPLYYANRQEYLSVFVFRQHWYRAVLHQPWDVYNIRCGE